MDISKITDVTELKLLAHDQYVIRDNAAIAHQNAERNLAAINTRLQQVFGLPDEGVTQDTGEAPETPPETIPVKGISSHKQR